MRNGANVIMVYVRQKCEVYPEAVSLLHIHLQIAHGAFSSIFLEGSPLDFVAWMGGRATWKKPCVARAKKVELRIAHKRSEDRVFRAVLVGCWMDEIHSMGGLQDRIYTCYYQVVADHWSDLVICWTVFDTPKRRGKPAEPGNIRLF
jgi:hypothetical protein